MAASPVERRVRRRYRSGAWRRQPASPCGARRRRSRRRESRRAAMASTWRRAVRRSARVHQCVPDAFEKAVRGDAGDSGPCGSGAGAIQPCVHWRSPHERTMDSGWHPCHLNSHGGRRRLAPRAPAHGGPRRRRTRASHGRARRLGARVVISISTIEAFSSSGTGIRVVRSSNTLQAS